MRIFTHLREITPKHFNRPVVTVGVFDGVHRGHQAILQDLCNLADEERGEGVVLTFDRHPDEVLKGSGPPWIHSLPHRLLLLSRAGADNAVVVPFDKEMAAVTAEEFIQTILKDRFGAVGLVMGPGNNFGKGGRGDIQLVRQMAKEYRLRVRETLPVVVRGRRASATAIREAILAGDLELTTAMMGGPVTLLGKVVEGEGRGKQIGFPTANLDVAGELHPPNGVYAATTSFQRKIYRSMLNIGVRPTFAEGKKTVEVHVFDFEGDLYGLTLEVAIITRLRDEKKFKKVGDLTKQLRKDQEAALNALGATPTE